MGGSADALFLFFFCAPFSFWRPWFVLWLLPFIFLLLLYVWFLSPIFSKPSPLTPLPRDTPSQSRMTSHDLHERGEKSSSGQFSRRPTTQKKSLPSRGLRDIYRTGGNVQQQTNAHDPVSRHRFGRGKGERTVNTIYHHHQASSYAYIHTETTHLPIYDTYSGGGGKQRWQQIPHQTIFPHIPPAFFSTYLCSKGKRLSRSRETEQNLPKYSARPNLFCFVFEHIHLSQ